MCKIIQTIAISVVLRDGAGAEMQRLEWQVPPRQAAPISGDLPTILATVLHLTRVVALPLPSDDDDEGSREKPSQTDNPSQKDKLPFINLGVQSKGRQPKNGTVVRSHVARTARRTKQERYERLRNGGLLEVSFVKGHSSQNELDSATAVMQIERFFRTSWASNSTKLSQRPSIELQISALQTYKGKTTPHLHDLFGYYGENIWGFFYPAEDGMPAPLTLDWFSLVRKYPPLFHAACYGAAQFLDIVRGSLFYSVTPEIINHKAEAIRLIKQEVETGIDLPEVLILAILTLVEEASVIIERKRARAISKPEVSPFSPPSLLMDWEQLGGTRSEAPHAAGYVALVRMKGGVEKLQERVIQTAVAYNGLLEAMFEISKPPVIGFYTLPKLRSRMADPTRNVPLRTVSAKQRSSFTELLAFGLTREALDAIMEMVTVMNVVENFIQGSLENADLLALSSMRDHARHRLWSLPTGEVLLGASGQFSLYECFRLGALMFAVSLFFPMPRSTGMPQELMQRIKQWIEQTDIALLSSLGVGRFFIWLLTLTGIAADCLPERQWFEEKLTDLLMLEGVSTWMEVESIAESFIWVQSACEEGAVKLWEKVAANLS